MREKKILIYTAFISVYAFAWQTQQAETSTFQSSPVTVSSYYDIDGGKYYRVHIVEKGHTLYSIARAYKCAVSDIIKNSPQGDNAISIGEMLRIPLFDRQQISLLKRYNVKDTLAKRMEQQQLHGQSQSLQAPQHTHQTQSQQQLQQQSQEQSQSLQASQHTHQTQSQQLQEQHLQLQPKQEKDIINISLMLPLYTSDTFSPQKQFYFISLLQGVLLAMEEINESATPKINVNVFDLTESESSWNVVKNNSKFLESDIILCAAFKNIFPRLDSFSRKNHIPLIHLHSERDSMSSGNPYFMQLLPSQTTQLEILADTFITNFNRSNFVIFVEDVTNVDKFQAAQHLYSLLEKAKSEKKFHPHNIHLYDPNQTGYEEFPTLLDEKNYNVVCGFTYQEIRLANMFVPLLKNNTDKANGMLINDYDISLFGPAAWAYFTKIDPELFYRTSFTYFNTFATKLNTCESKDFEKKFYNTFGTLPDGMAYKGYMFSKWIFEALQQYNLNFISNLKECNEYSVMGMRFNFVRSRNGFENRSIEFVKFFD